MFDNKEGLSKTMSQSSVEEVDAVSTEICSLHDYLITSYMKNEYEEGDVVSDAYLLTIKKFILDKVASYDLKYMNKDEFSNDAISDDDFLYICSQLLNSDTLNLLGFEKYNQEKIFDFSLIENVSNLCASQMESLFYLSQTPKEFEELYYAYVEEELSKVQDINDYMCIRFYSDMYLSSFITWCNYFYGYNKGKEGFGKWASGVWKRVKSAAKETWKEVKPIVTADAGGAVSGAVLGSAVGGIGAGPGAATGAAGASIAECVQQLAQ